jgi:hypothetical protein
MSSRLQRRFQVLSKEPFFGYLMEARSSLSNAVASIPNGYTNTVGVRSALMGCIGILDSLRGIGSKVENVE